MYPSRVAYTPCSYSQSKINAVAERSPHNLAAAISHDRNSEKIYGKMTTQAL